MANLREDNLEALRAKNVAIIRHLQAENASIDAHLGGLAQYEAGNVDPAVSLGKIADQVDATAALNSLAVSVRQSGVTVPANGRG